MPLTNGESAIGMNYPGCILVEGNAVMKERKDVTKTLKRIDSYPL